MYAYVANDPLNLVDPSGEFAWWIAGGAIGFGVDLSAQYLESKLSGRDFSFDWQRSLVASGTGALTGGASAIVAQQVGKAALRAGANAAIGAGANTGQTAVMNKLKGTDHSLASAALLGAAFGAGGSLVGDAGSAIASARISNPIKQLTVGQKNILSKVVNNSRIDFSRPTPGIVAATGAASNITSNSPAAHSQRRTSSAAKRGRYTTAPWPS